MGQVEKLASPSLVACMALRSYRLLLQWSRPDCTRHSSVKNTISADDPSNGENPSVCVLNSRQQ